MDEIFNEVLDGHGQIETEYEYPIWPEDWP